MNKIGEINIEQVDLGQAFHKAALLELNGWAGWQLDNVEEKYPDLHKEAFLVFGEEGESALGFGVVKPVEVNPQEVVLGAWSIKPGAPLAFETGEVLTKYIEETGQHDSADLQPTVFFVGDDPLSAVVAMVKSPQSALMAQQGVAS